MANRIFTKILRLWPNLNIYLFASRLNNKINNKLKLYYAWTADPGAVAIDAFATNWNDNFYAFPTFSMITRVLQKVRQDACSGVIVVPAWRTQVRGFPCS